MTAIDVPTELEQRTIRAMRHFSRPEPDRFVARILASDPELATLLAIYAGAKVVRSPLRRDALSR